MPRARLRGNTAATTGGPSDACPPYSGEGRPVPMAKEIVPAMQAPPFTTAAVQQSAVGFLSGRGRFGAGTSGLFHHHFDETIRAAMKTHLLERGPEHRSDQLIRDDHLVRLAVGGGTERRGRQTIDGQHRERHEIDRRRLAHAGLDRVQGLRDKRVEDRNSRAHPALQRIWLAAFSAPNRCASRLKKMLTSNGSL